jgi:hypothetical protein
VCVHVECSCILGLVIVDSMLLGSMVAYVEERETKEVSHMTSCTVIINENGSGDAASPEWGSTA